ncbi:MAG TPA: polysaccharide deacetylase family protein [Bacteroidia bacterium]|nr:polysaccharide deacetylase family protein [Bacteroidia bacterium]
MNSVLVYTHKLSNRSKYMFRLYFRELLGLELKMTDNADEFIAAEGVKVSYTQQPLKDELFFYSRHLLFETGITEQNISVFDWEGNPVFFATGKTSALPFDPFASGFYLVSRYEEYLPHIRDSNDRFDAHNSLAYQHKFLEKPVVNQWAEMIRKKLSKKYPELKFPVKNYRYEPTIDIDNAYAYRQKGFMRTVGGYAKAFFKFDFEDIRMRTRVLTRTRKDPYDTYAYQLELQKKYSLKPVYFFLVGDYGVNDKNLSTQNRRFRELIRHISDYAEVGVHPSFGSNAAPSRLQVEISRLKNILHRDITQSRQHFLMLKFPNTYRNLIDRDITDDYSMGFANEIGFRAGICTPFNFYDLDLESETTLRIHPFAAMDATLNLYMHLSPEEALQKVKNLIVETKKVNGVFISLWHNETLSDEKQWKGWKKVYEEIVEEAVK